ncbi:MAG: hypothetical protein A2Y82_04670 [Candidatus Buchananbacteria bacterium RBG_13_36_9]|uniref:Uncharacterized protein n=1 Tax=Candidatus Buchananbacteria bacterium RBG_13_36_9 TaxID=1797530 RepID=A0A1G1XSW5_9BACT|nr:MAG: hypothetical protein A2Y82_04670 [Candidatus Buchananbacteria bacterium RBG_13_36_9]
MPITKLNEQIEVITKFTKQGAQPAVFKYAGKKWVVEKINLVYEKKTGDGKLVYFSVTSQGNYFKLVFETNNLKWRIGEVYHE